MTTNKSSFFLTDFQKLNIYLMSREELRKNFAVTERSRNVSIFFTSNINEKFQQLWISSSKGTYDYKRNNNQCISFPIRHNLHILFFLVKGNVKNSTIYYDVLVTHRTLRFYTRFARFVLMAQKASDRFSEIHVTENQHSIIV